MNKEQQKKLITEIMNDDAKDGLYISATKSNADMNIGVPQNMTAVKWLVKQVFGEHTSVWNDVIEQAKQMEKEQIIDAWREGDNDSMYSPKELDQQAEQYYNETYGKLI